MNELNVNTFLGKAPAVYDQRQMDQLIRNIERMFQLALMPGEISVTQVYAKDLPTDPANLKNGALWYDEANDVIRRANP
jgi:hypothetical protein